MGRARNRSGMEGFMNDIITRLDEIEERADAILAETENRKNDMAKQLEADKQAIDVKYDKMLKAHMQELSERLRGEAKREIERISGENDVAIARLSQIYEEQREQLAQQIVKRIVTLG